MPLSSKTSNLAIASRRERCFPRLRKNSRCSATLAEGTSISSVVGGAGLLLPPDGAGVGRGQDRDAVAMGDRGRCSVGRSSSERRGDLALAQAQRRRTQQTLLAARLDDRARRSSSQRIRRRAACSRPNAEASRALAPLRKGSSAAAPNRDTLPLPTKR